MYIIFVTIVLSLLLPDCLWMALVHWRSISGPTLCKLLSFWAIVLTLQFCIHISGMLYICFQLSKFDEMLQYHTCHKEMIQWLNPVGLRVDTQGSQVKASLSVLTWFTLVTCVGFKNSPCHCQQNTVIARCICIGVLWIGLPVNVMHQSMADFGLYDMGI